MKPALYVVVAAVVLIAFVRRWRRGSGGVARRVLSVVGQHTPLGETGLVAAREIRERLRGRFFRVVTLILLAVVGAAIVIPTTHSTRVSRSSIGIVGPLSPAQEAAIVAAVERSGSRADLVRERDVRQARSALRSGRVTLVVEDGRSVLVKTATSASPTNSTQTVAAVASALGVERAFRVARLSARQIAAVAHARPVPVTSVQTPSSTGSARTTSLIGIILIFIMLTQYLTWTLMGVLEEKVSRVVEVLLATVRPIQLLGGKLLGIGAVALLQAGVVVGFALVLANAVGSSMLKGTASLVVVASLVWLVVGYAFYSWVYAAAGSMTARQDQVQSLALPLSTPLIFGYIVALSNAGPGAPSLLVKVLAYLPPTAPFAMPLLVAKGAVQWFEFVLSIVASAACTIAVARLAASVYRRAVLRTGRRVGIREVLSMNR